MRPEAWPRADKTKLPRSSRTVPQPYSLRRKSSETKPSRGLRAVTSPCTHDAPSPAFKMRAFVKKRTVRRFWCALLSVTGNVLSTRSDPATGKRTRGRLIKLGFKALWLWGSSHTQARLGGALTHAAVDECAHNKGGSGEGKRRGLHCSRCFQVRRKKHESFTSDAGGMLSVVFRRRVYGGTITARLGKKYVLQRHTRGGKNKRCID